VRANLPGYRHPAVAARRGQGRADVTMTRPSTADMAAKLRRVLIAARFRAPHAAQPTPEEITIIRLAWEDLGAQPRESRCQGPAGLINPKRGRSQVLAAASVAAPVNLEFCHPEKENGLPSAILLTPRSGKGKHPLLSTFNL
jgi:hypothetical protein